MRQACRLLACILFVTNSWSTEPWAPELSAELARRAADDRFSGSVLIARNGETLFEAAVGQADREHGIANTIDTKFRFGSMGKMFTAVAVLQLAQAGRIGLDDPLGKYLTGYPNKEIAKVTLHQLLTHTGGTGDIFGPEFDARRLQLRTLQDYVSMLGARSPEFPPGSRHQYSNYGFILLGRVIEVVSGKSYDAYVREKIFSPAGMGSTDNLPESQKVPGLAVPYTGHPPHSAEHTLPWSGTSAGGGYSTVGDMLKFSNALLSHRLLDEGHTRQLVTGKVAAPMPGLRYAYGFEDAQLPDGLHRIGHGGGSMGMNGMLAIYPETGYVVVVLANLDPPAALSVNRLIADRVVSPARGSGTRPR